MRVTIFLIFSIIGISPSFVAAQYPASVALFVEQKRPLLPSLQPLFDSGVTWVEGENNIIQVEQVPARNWLGQRLAEFGVLTPKERIILSINSENLPFNLQDAEMEEITWAFSKDYYLPETPIAGNTISVTAWRSFPVTAKIEWRDETNFQPYTYTTWVNVD